jgi:hypothetical protein
VLTPQVGLVPLGLDPQSGLEEFADPATGVVPERDAAGALVRNETTAVVFVLLPGGGFTMGAQKADPAQPNYDPMAFVTEGPVHRVELSAFFLSKYEMTRAQWQTIMGDDPSDQYKTGQVVRGIVIDRRHPVTHTSWLSCDTITSRAGGYCRPRHNGNTRAVLVRRRRGPPATTRRRCSRRPISPMARQAGSSPRTGRTTPA